jgi:hypothetical protein
VKRAFILGAIVTATLASVPAMASQTPHREVSAHYLVGGLDGVLSGGSEAQGQETGSAISIPIARKERNVGIALKDSSSSLAAARVAQDVDGDGRPDEELGTVCGAGHVHLSQGGTTLMIYPVVASCPLGPAITTRGVVTVRPSDSRFSLTN